MMIFLQKPLQPIWQWNHLPVNDKWSLTKGAFRLNTLPAKNFMYAKNTLTQRIIGPESSAAVQLDVKKLKVGDVAGLGLLNVPYYWIGVAKTDKGLVIRSYDLVNNKTLEEPLKQTKVFLRAFGDFDKDLATLSYSTDGINFKELGTELRLAYQKKTFQGVRFALFAFNTEGNNGGYADFDNFKIDELLSDRSKNSPIGKIVTFTNFANNQLFWNSPRSIIRSANTGSKDFDIKTCHVKILDKGNGKITLDAVDGSGFLTVSGIGLSGDLRTQKTENEGSLFLWQDMLKNQCMLLSLKTNRYVGVNVLTGETYSADWAGEQPDKKNGTVFEWKLIKN